MRKTLVLHVGYHQTGAGLIHQWLIDHAEILSPLLQIYGPDETGPEGADTGPLRKAAVALSCGRPGAADDLAREARLLAARMRTEEAPALYLADEGLLGLPLGFVEPGYVETEIYPALYSIIDVLAREFADFDLVFAVFERAPDVWLQNLHALMVRHGAFQGDLAAYLSHFEPSVHWEDLRHEIRFALQGRGRLETFAFETEFRGGQVTKMGLMTLLHLPQDVLAQCRPTLRRPPDPVSTARAQPPETPGETTRPEAASPQDPKSPQTPVPHRQAAPGQVSPNLAPLKLARLPLDKPCTLILGGPNEMVPEGWAALLRRDYAALTEICNLSMGACTSAMALYRLLAQGDRWPEAAVLWEQGLNEDIHLAGGQSLDSLLYHVEWLLQLCQRADRPFVPVLMRSRTQAAQPDDSPYITRIKALFAAYGVTVVDCNRLLQVLARGPIDPDQWYLRNAMYDTGTAFPRALAETVLIALDGARVPVAPPDRAAHFAPLDLRLRTPDETPETFDTPAMRYDFARFETQPRIATTGRALAAIIATSGSGPVIRLKAADQTLGRFATQVPHGATLPPRQLRQLVLGSDPHGLEIPGRVVQIDVDDSTETPIVQTMYHQGERPTDPLSAGVVALLCEEPREQSGMTDFPQSKDIDS